MRAHVRSGLKRFKRFDSTDGPMHFDTFAPKRCSEEAQIPMYPTTFQTVEKEPIHEEHLEIVREPTRRGYDSEDEDDVTPTFVPSLNSDSSADLNRTAPDNTTIIVDWDDTIFPSTQLSRLDLDIFSPGASAQLKHKYQALHQQMIVLDELATTFFQTAPDSGMVIIVTNADKGWVELSCAEFLPRTWETLQQYGILIVSARHQYSRFSPHRPVMWKYHTFLDLLSKMYPDPKSRCRLNCISIGDSDSEKLALFKVTNSLSSDPYAKSVKFIEGPNVSYLHLQLRYVTMKMEGIARAPGVHDWLMAFDAPE